MVTAGKVSLLQPPIFETTRKETSFKSIFASLIASLKLSYASSLKFTSFLIPNLEEPTPISLQCNHHNEKSCMVLQIF
jgi:hypothetical protein